jgi:competence protein ComEA
MNKEKKVDINFASKEELISVKGIGPALAEKIINNRPYSDIDDLTKVQGIGETSLETIKANLLISTQEKDAEFQAFVESIRGDTRLPEIDGEEGAEHDEDLPEEHANVEEVIPEEKSSELETDWEKSNVVADASDIENEEIPEPEILDADVKILEEEVDLQEEPILEKQIDIEVEGGKGKEPVEAEEHTQKEQVGATFQKAEQAHEKELEIEKSVTSENWITRSQLIWSMIGTAVFSIILTALITLGILSATNGGLRYATINDAKLIENQITLLNDVTTTMKTDIESLKTRLDTLETVAGRVTALETRADEVDGEIEVIQSSIKEMSEILITVQEEIDALQIAAEKSSQFRTGLLQLLQEIDGTTEEGK